MLCFFRFLWQN